MPIVVGHVNLRIPPIVEFGIRVSLEGFLVTVADSITVTRRIPFTLLALGLWVGWSFYWGGYHCNMCLVEKCLTSYLQSGVEGTKSPRLCHGEPLYAQSRQLAEYFPGSSPSSVPSPHVVLAGLSCPFRFPLAFVDLLELPSPLYLDGHWHLMDAFGAGWGQPVDWL